MLLISHLTTFKYFYNFIAKFAYRLHIYI
jgi:hypothetical protein